MKMKHFVSILFGLFIVLASVFVFMPSKSPTVEGQKASVRLAWIPGATFAGDYVADKKGFWKAEKLDIEVRPGGFENDAIKLVAAGVDTFGVTSGPQLLQARASGIPIIALASTIPDSPIGWVSKANSGIKTPQDFAGKKIGAQIGTHTEATLDALMAKLGIATSSFRRIPVKFDPRPFVVGDVDVLPVYIIDQPIDLEAAGIQLNIIDPRDYGVALAYGNLYFTTEKTLREQPEMVKRFLRGAKRGWLDAYKDRDGAVDILMVKMGSGNRETIRRKLDSMFSFIEKSQKQYKGLFVTEAGRWQSTLEILAKFDGLAFKQSINEIFKNVELN